MKKYLILLFCLVLCAGLLSACGCKHDWNAENCGPVTCNLCGKESDVVREHIWDDATCLLPQTCYNCGATQGAALGHSWVEAGCTAPKTCTACALTEGEPLGHGETLWVYEADLNMMGTLEKGSCPTCGESMGTRTVPPESFAADGRFTFSPAQFEAYFHGCFNAEEAMTTELAGSSEGEMRLSFTKENALLGYVRFYKDGQLMTAAQKDETGLDKLEFYVPYSTAAAAQTTIFLSCCDPENRTPDAPENMSAAAKTLYRELMDGYNGTKEDRFTVERNGVSYCFAPFQEDGQLWYYLEVIPGQ